nr:ATP-dependent DNA helicase DinG [Priestia taiwanensis]
MRVKNRYVVIDLETTGNASKTDERIIQFAAVVIEEGKIVHTYSTFLYPEKPIPSFITELTGIHDEMVEGAPLFEEIADDVLELLKDSYFVAHNVQFDLNFLHHEFNRIGIQYGAYRTIDTVELARILLPTIDSYKLGDLASYFAFTHENPHQADSDALVTAELLLMFIEKLDTLPITTLKQLQVLSRYLQSNIYDLISRILIRKMLCVNEDEKRYDIYRGIAIKNRTFTMQFDEEDVPDFQTFKKERLAAIMSTHMDVYEEREGQLQMMDMVNATFSNKKVAMIEAGTGIGKSLAYLLPAIFFAKKTEMPVVVSTQTTQLQHQLVEKDIPMLRKIVPFSFEVALIKGRHHYLCLYKFEHALQEEDTNYDIVLTKAKILVWLTETETGDVDELNLPTGGKLLWNRICSDTYNPTTKRNPWHARCFYQRAIHRLFVADLIVTNHAMLLTDLSDDGLLSSYEHVVLDEAHHIEEVASRSTGLVFQAKRLHQLLTRIGTLDQRELLSKLKEEWCKSAYAAQFGQVDALLRDVKMESDDLFRLLHAYVLHKNKKQLAMDINRMTYRYDTTNDSDGRWAILVEVANRVYTMLRNLLDKMKEMKSFVLADDVHQVKQIEFMRVIDALDEMTDILHKLLLTRNEDITWMEVEAKGTFHSTILYSQPIDVSNELATRFFAKKKSVVLTSATLTVHDSFQYVIQSLGLQELHVTTMSIPSPFPYKQLVNMYVPTDIPTIKEVSQEAYVTNVANYLAKLAEVTEGKMLVLFTAADMLKKTYQLMKEMESMGEFVLLAQGVNSGSRTRLTKNFQQFKKAILFGTTSFWEGIDVPGEGLSCLVMVRLPFAPPDAPVSAAKMDKIKREGGNPFKEYSLPQAIIRFKQGFGRLIRTKDDKGTFVVLDKRITTAFYGKNFLHSIPHVPIQELEMNDIIESVREEKS